MFTFACVTIGVLKDGIDLSRVGTIRATDDTHFRRGPTRDRGRRGGVVRRPEERSVEVRQPHRDRRARGDGGRTSPGDRHPAGKAVEFGGVEDALFLKVHPLEGAETFTWRVIFRPDAGGAGSALRLSGKRHGHADVVRDPRGRRQVVPGQFRAVWQGIESATGSREVHTLGRGITRRPCTTARNIATTWTACWRARRNCTWRRRARADVVGTRINRRDYFKGAVLEARINRALPPAEFLKVPASLIDGATARLVRLPAPRGGCGTDCGHDRWLAAFVAAVVSYGLFCCARAGRARDAHGIGTARVARPIRAELGEGRTVRVSAGAS